VWEEGIDFMESLPWDIHAELLKNVYTTAEFRAEQFREDRHVSTRSKTANGRIN